MSKVYDIGILPGDGIGEEVVREGMKVLSAAEEVFGFETRRENMPYGAEHFLETGEMMPEAAFDRIRDMHAVLLGAIGDPRIEVGKLEFAIIGGLRFKLDLFVNLRPIRLFHESLCPLKDKGPADVDMVFCRENTEDAYSGIYGFFKKGTSEEIANQTMLYTRRGTERIIRYAFDLARKRGPKPGAEAPQVTLIDKANAVRAQDIWTRTFEEVVVFVAQVRDQDHQGALGNSRHQLLCGRQVVRGPRAGTKVVDRVEERLEVAGALARRKPAPLSAEREQPHGIALAQPHVRQ